LVPWSTPCSCRPRGPPAGPARPTAGQPNSGRPDDRAAARWGSSVSRGRRVARCAAGPIRRRRRRMSAVGEGESARGQLDHSFFSWCSHATPSTGPGEWPEWAHLGPIGADMHRSVRAQTWPRVEGGNDTRAAAACQPGAISGESLEEDREGERYERVVWVWT
jgi:hypothetical protein